MLKGFGRGPGHACAGEPFVSVNSTLCDMWEGGQKRWHFFDDRMLNAKGNSEAI